MASAASHPSAHQEWIAERLRHIELSDLSLWDDLDVLSTHTRVEATEVPAEGVVVGAGGRFSAVLNLYVTLQYGNNDNEGFTTSDSFLAKVAGRVEGEKIVVEESSVDTSAFYE